MGDYYTVEIESGDLSSEKSAKIVDALEKAGAKIEYAYSREKINEKLDTFEEARKLAEQGKISVISFEMKEARSINVTLDNNHSVSIWIKSILIEPWRINNPWRNTIRKTFDKLVELIQEIIGSGKVWEYFGSDKLKKAEYVFGEDNFNGYYLRQGFEEKMLEPGYWK